VVARFKDDGYSAFKEVRRDDFVNLIGAVERDEVELSDGAARSAALLLGSNAAAEQVPPDGDV
jgi:hypothetical protein